MSPLDCLRFAWGALSGHRLRTLLSLMGMAIGVAAVVALTALGEGARRYVTREFSDIGTNLLIVVPGKTETTGAVPGFGGVPNDLTLQDAEAVRRSVREAEKVAPIAMGTESVAWEERRRQVAVVGTTPEFLAVRNLTLAAGEFLPPEEVGRGAAVTVLGWETARELFPDQDPVGRVVRIGGWRMRVIGVLASRGVQVGVDLDEIAVVPVATAMRMFNRTSLFRIVLQVRSHADLPATSDKVRALLTDRHGEEDVTCITQDAVLSTFSTILTALTLALAAIAAVSLSVAGIGIMNVMLVSVAERISEVGLIKAVGGRGRQVLAVFLAEAALLALAGGGVGLGIGWGGLRIFAAFYPDFPAVPPWWAVAAALILSLTAGVLFGVIPARRAVRLDPVTALARR